MPWETYNPKKQIRKDAMTLSIGLKGGFGISPMALESLGHPREVVLQYDRETHQILVRPPQHQDEPRLRVTRDERKDGRDGGHMAGSGFCAQFGLNIRQITRMVGEVVDEGVVFTLPPEAWPKEAGPTSNGQRMPERAVV